MAAETFIRIHHRRRLEVGANLQDKIVDSL